MKRILIPFGQKAEANFRACNQLYVILETHRTDLLATADMACAPAPAGSINRYVDASLLQRENHLFRARFVVPNENDPRSIFPTVFLGELRGSVNARIVSELGQNHPSCSP